MDRYFIALGSNLGCRTDNLRNAFREMSLAGMAPLRTSTVLETSPHLLPGSPPAWNRPYLNCVTEVGTQLSAAAGLDALQSIESKLGRDHGAPRWSPRVVDLDIVMWGGERLQSPTLTVPHPRLLERDFVLGPLAELAGSLIVPGTRLGVLDAWRRLKRQEPVWMGIMNLTPDSFSDGGLLNREAEIEERVASFMGAGAHVIDLGAESTRPRALPVAAEQEWARLAPALRHVRQVVADGPVAPKISVDTRHPEVAALALEAGVDIVNDVSGLTTPAMLELAAGSKADWIAMHHTSIPADPARLLPVGCDPVEEVVRWFRERQREWERAGLDLDRVVVDPGVGFGKSADQSWALLRGIEGLYALGHRVLVGHSRKSFIGAVSSVPAPERDVETVATSLRLLDAGVSMFRVHDVDAHVRAYRAWRKL